MLHSLFMFSVFRRSPLQKECEVKKPKAAIKGVCHRFSKSVSVDGQKNADKNWSVQPLIDHYKCVLICLYMPEMARDWLKVIFIIFAIIGYRCKVSNELCVYQNVWSTWE